MNIVNRLFLKTVLLPRKLYAGAGINTEQLQSILSVKLMMDDRRPNTFQQTQQRKKEKQVSTATLGTMFISAILGLMFLLVFSIGENVVTQLTLYFSMFIFMLASTLIADFTSVLIDIRDNFIIMPKPVNDRTVVVARLLHIFIHICKLILPMTLPGFIYIIVNFSFLASLPFVLMVLLATMFTIFLINMVYIIILRITTPEKFKSIISYIQIAFAIIIYAGYQLVPRLMKDVMNTNIDLSHNASMLFAPSYWFAAGWNIFHVFKGSLNEWVAFVAALFIPVSSIYIVVKYMAPSFNQKLAMISGSETVETKSGHTVSTGNKLASPYLRWFSGVLTHKGAERMGFLFAWKMTGRSRDFKLKVYPSIGYLVVIIVMMFLRSGNAQKLGSIASDPKGLRIIIVFALYMLSLLMITAINQMIYSEKYKAAWLYFTAPVDTPGKIIAGAAKAVILKFYIPLVVIISTIGIYLLGVHFIPNLLLALSNTVLIACCMVYIGFRDLPFSKPQGNNARAGSFLKSLISLVVPGLLGIFHFLIYSITPVVIISAVLSVAATWLVMDAIKRTPWQKIKAQYE